LSASPHLRLGVNVDHVATIRNARGGRHPDPVRAAKIAIEAGADGITAHLREDRRIWWGAFVTCWFWLVGAVALSLLPPLVKNVLGGNEEVVTVCLAIFSI